MSDSNLYNFEPDLKSELLNCYEIAGDSEKQQDELKSSILAELEEIEQNFADKNFHATGGMKQICRVKDMRTSRPIAMAELKNQSHCTQEEIQRFLREARITAALEHPNIVPIYEMGVNQWRKPFFTMKFLKDQNLKKIIRELIKANPVYTKTYTLNTLLNIFLKVCDAVAFAHSCHVVHLDLKPENIMIGDYGEVYVCDWGLAKLLASADEVETGTVTLDAELLNDVTLTGVVRGTPGYMAPEQIDTKIAYRNEKTDIYALGAILYTLLTLRRPFHGMTVSDVLKNTLKGKLKESKNLKSSVPESLNAVARKAMSIKQSERYENVAEMASEIRAYQEGFATEAENANFAKALWLLLKRHRMLSMMLFLVMALTVGMGAKIKLNELKARQALVMYSQEKKDKEQKIIDAAPLQIESWRENIGSLNLDWVLTQINEILEIKPEHEDSLRLKALILFIKGNFQKSHSIYAKLGNADDNIFGRMSLATYLSSKKSGYLKASEACRIIEKERLHKEQPLLASKFWGSVFRQLPTISEKERFVAAVLELYNNCDEISVEKLSPHTLKNITVSSRQDDLVSIVHTSYMKHSTLHRIPINNKMDRELIKKYALRIISPRKYTANKDNSIPHDLKNAGAILKFNLPDRVLKGLSFDYQKTSSNFYHIAVEYSIDRGKSWNNFPHSPKRHYITNSAERVHQFHFSGEITGIDAIRIVFYANVSNRPLCHIIDNLKLKLLRPNNEHAYSRLTFNPIKAKLTESNGKWQLDLSKNSFLTGISGLENIPLSRINLSGTSISDLNLGHNPAIKHIDLSQCHSAINLLGLQQLPNLRSIILPAFKRNSPLEESLKEKKVKITFDAPEIEESE